jgi:class 3 adenylate cyclase/tetratricopeptide (TPR) repeat protein
MLVRMAACPGCGSANVEGARFCSACGAALVETPARRERKVVTVLFCDLVGFTSGAERLDPEDVHATLQPYAGRLRAELERFGGTVEKFVGDAVMALFGAPIAREDDPERAVRAALAIRDAVAELNEPSPPMELRVRIGVNTGEALVALGARPREGEGMAAGDVVNTAARLEQAAPVNAILVGETTYRATRHAIDYAEAAPVAAKGKAEPLGAWEALATRAPSGRELVEAARVPLIGRDEELEALRRAFARACREREPQLVTLVGVPGIGKSRLVTELAAAVEQEPELVFWRQGRSLPYGEGVTFWALAEMAKAQAGILHSDRVAVAAAKLAEVVAALVSDEGEARWLEAELRPLVGLDLEREEGARRDTEFAAWRRFFEAMAERRPLVLVFEDLHWADDALLDFVDELVDRSTDVPLLVVATARPDLYERRASWGGGKRNALTITLAPLEDAETARLLGLLLERAVLPAESQSELLTLVGGVPLCAEEYVRMLEDRGLLKRGRLTGELPLPETVQAVIAARLDALRPDEKAVVQAASVLGRSFWVGGLAAVTARDTVYLEDRLHGLARKEFVRRERRSAVANERQYTFRHVLVRDVAYGQIPRGERSDLHRRAAEWIESLAPERAEERAEMLAHHYVAALDFALAARQPTGELAERARLVLREAGDRAAALSAFAAAARFYGRALELWPEDDPEVHQLRLRYGRVLMRGEQGGAAHVTAARDALLALNVPAEAGEAEVVLADLAWREGRHDDAIAGYRRAAELVENVTASPTKALVLHRVTGFLMADAQYEQALEVGGRTVKMAEELGLDDLKAGVLTSIGVARVNLGDARGLDDLSRSLELAIANGSVEAAVRSHFNLASTLANLGDLPHAFEHYARGAAGARRLDDLAMRRWFEAEALYERWWRGEWDDALAVAAALRDVGADADAWLAFDAALVCGAILSARGELAPAQREFDRVLSLARGAATPQALLPALAWTARFGLESGDDRRARLLLGELLGRWREIAFIPGFWVADTAAVAAGLGAEQEFMAVAAGVRAPTRWLEAGEADVAGRPRAAAEVYARIGSRPDEAHARLRAARALANEGLPAEADGELQRALAFYRETGAARYLAEAEPLAAALA